MVPSKSTIRIIGLNTLTHGLSQKAVQEKRVFLDHLNPGI